MVNGWAVLLSKWVNWIHKYVTENVEEVKSCELYKFRVWWGVKVTALQAKSFLNYLQFDRFSVRFIFFKKITRSFLSLSVLQCALWVGWRCLRKTWHLGRAVLQSTTASDSSLITNTTFMTRLVSGERWGETDSTQPSCLFFFVPH